MIALNPINLVDPFGTRSIGQAVRGLVDFVKQNWGALSSIIMDLLAPLGALMDALAAATGYDIPRMIEEGFKRIRELSWWQRLKSGVAALAGIGGVVSVIAKLDDILNNIRSVVAAIRGGMSGRGALAAVRGLRRRSSTGCFAAGTLVLASSASAIPIESIELGQSVSCLPVHPGAHGSAAGFDGSATCPESPYRVDLALDSGGRVSILRSGEWLEGNSHAVGSRIWVEIDGLGVSGSASILGVSRVSPITISKDPGARPVVATYRGFGELLEINLEGHHRPLLTTGEHPIFSETRNSWVAARQLVVGEALSGLLGPVKVASKRQIEGVHPVFNLEVLESNTFFVGEAGVLVHNNCRINDILKGAKPGRKTKGRTKQYVKNGGMKQADSDFDSLGPTNVGPISGGRAGKLGDGSQVNVRSNSTDGRPTLEIKRGKRRTKIRYDE